MLTKLIVALALISFVSENVCADAELLQRLHDAIDKASSDVIPQVIKLRRDFHEHPELSNREFRTSKIVADHLRQLNLEVRTGVARTGVIGIMRCDAAGPVVALRADMDALPGTEDSNLLFKSIVRAELNGREVGVMHACGHDAHTAILLGTAEVLARMKAELRGTVAGADWAKIQLWLHWPLSRAAAGLLFQRNWRIAILHSSARSTGSSGSHP
jgi:hypothetical protein